MFNFLLDFSLYAPIAIIYFSRVAGSYTLGASVLSLIMLSAAVLELPTGIWSDWIGRRKTLIVGSWSRLIAIICYAIGLNYWWLVAGAILEGLSRAFYSGNNDAFLHDTLEDHNRTDQYELYLGRTKSYEHLAMAISALLGGIIANFSFLYLMWLSVLPQTINLFVCYFFIEPKKRAPLNTNIYAHTLEAIKLFIKNKKLRLLSIADTISLSTGEVSFQFRATFFASLWPVWAIGALSTFTQFGATASYFFSNQLIKRLGHEKLLVVRSIVGKLSGLIAFGLPSLFSPLITFFPSFLYGAGQVAKNSLMQREFTSHQRATMSSLNSLLSSLGFALISLVVGFFADRTSPAQALFFLTLISLPIIGLYWNIFRSSRRIAK